MECVGAVRRSEWNNGWVCIILFLVLLGLLLFSFLYEGDEEWVAGFILAIKMRLMHTTATFYFFNHF